MSALRFIPNALCILRMLLVVPVAWLLVHGEFHITLWVFAVAAATDGLDGFLAKRFDWTSELGKILDPLADKILLVGVFVTLAIMELVPLWLAGTAVARDLVISFGAIAYKSLYGDPHGHPTPVSKLNTLCQILFLLLVVAAHAVGDVPQNAMTAAMTIIMALGAVVFVTTVVSGIDYVITYTRKAMDVSRQRRSAAMKG